MYVQCRIDGTEGGSTKIAKVILHRFLKSRPLTIYPLAAVDTAKSAKQLPSPSVSQDVCPAVSNDGLGIVTPKQNERYDSIHTQIQGVK